MYTDPAEIRDRIADDRDIDVRFIILQAKRHVGFDGDALAKLAEGITQIFSPADLSIRAGKSARRLRECVRAIYADLDKFEASGPPRLEAWYASLGVLKPGLLRDKREAALARLNKVVVLRKGERVVRPFDPAEVAEVVTKLTTEGEIVRYLDSDPALSAVNLKKVATALNLAVPGTIKSKQATQLYIAESVVRDRSRWRLP